MKPYSAALVAVVVSFFVGVAAGGLTKRMALDNALHKLDQADQQCERFDEVAEALRVCVEQRKKTRRGCSGCDHQGWDGIDCAWHMDIVHGLLWDVQERRWD